MLVLDVCVGSEKMYKDRHKLLKDNFISIDIRKGNFTIPKKDRGLTVTGNLARVSEVSVIVKPIVLASMKFLPFIDKSIDIIVCDPPHLGLPENSLFTRIYGSWDKAIRISTIYRANIEFNRVLKDTGIIILKIFPDQADSYESLLSNFTFFLPIQTIRDKGCFSTKEAKLAAIWLIGIKKNE